MKVEHELPSAEARDLIDLAAEIAEKALKPRAEQIEEEGRFPREVFA